MFSFVVLRRQTFIYFLPGPVGDARRRLRDGESFQKSVWVAAQIVPEMPLMPYNLSTECENVNTGDGDLRWVWETANKD